ncbi:hypothetical protein MUG91_G46n21 [Manis pentadactyla]|nr:hypothetical protein MUG91_G46n21 [Manis pentadactyla]
MNGPRLCDTTYTGQGVSGVPGVCRPCLGESSLGLTFWSAKRRRECFSPSRCAAEMRAEQTDCCTNTDQQLQWERARGCLSWRKAGNQGLGCLGRRHRDGDVQGREAQHLGFKLLVLQSVKLLHKSQ